MLCCLLLGVTSCFNDDTSKQPVSDKKLSAIEQISQKIKENTSDVNLYITRSRLYREESRYDDAIRDMKKALSFDSSSIEIRHELSDLYFDNQQDNDALSILGETIALFPASERSLLKLSEFQYLLNKNDAALSTTEQLEKINPENPETDYMRGRILAQKGEDDKAIRAFKQALTKAEKHYDSLLELGTMYAQKKNKSALSYLKRALEINPSTDVIFEIGNYYALQGDDNKALEEYGKVVRKDPQYTEAHIEAGRIHLKNKEFEIASRLFNIAVETAPTYPPAYYYRGKSYLNLNEVEKAKADFNQALVFNSKYKEAENALENLAK